MKVPTYSERLARTKTAGGGYFLTAQANPNAWGAMGRAMSDIGDTVFKIGEEKYKIQAASDVNETIPLFTAEIESIKEKHKNNGNPIQAEKLVKKEMMNAYTRYTSGRMINAGTQQPYLSSRLAKSAFGTKASQLVSSGILNWKKANNSYIIELNKINESKIVSDNDTIAANTSLEIDARLNALNANHAVSLFNKNEPQDFSNYIGMPGKFAELAANGTFGSSKEFITRQKKSLENIVTGISLNLIKSKTHPSMSIAQTLRTGTAEELKTVDPILAKVFGMLDPKEKLDFIDKVRELENKMKKDNADAKKADAEASRAADDKTYKEIINTNFDNADERSSALEKFSTLKKNGYFTKPSEIEGMERLFEVDEDKETAKKTDPAVYNRLDELDEKNLLTRKAITDSIGGLDFGDYKNFLNRLVKERNDGASYVRSTIINKAFFIDKLTNDNTSLSTRFNTMRLSAAKAFEEYRNSLAGTTATHAQIIQAGKDIMIPYQEEINSLFKTTFDQEVTSFKNTYSAQFTSFRPENPNVQWDGKYTHANIMMFLVEKGTASDAAYKSWLNKFEKYIGVVGADTWNN